MGWPPCVPVAAWATEVSRTRWAVPTRSPAMCSPAAGQDVIARGNRASPADQAASRPTRTW